MKEVKINTGFIKLDQFLKLANLCSSGGEAKEIIQRGSIIVNGETELRRGKKLTDGDIVVFEQGKYIIRQDGGKCGDKETSS